MVVPTNFNYSDLNPLDSTSTTRYTGYTVNSGHFIKVDNDKTYSVISQRNLNLFGRVSIKLLSKNVEKVDIGVFKGQQIGDYFGYNIVVDDFNNDKRDDIAISAPFYSKRGQYENGAVHIFINKWLVSNGTYNYNFRDLPVMTSDFEGNGRFGLAMGKIGDINLDGYKGKFESF